MCVSRHIALLSCFLAMASLSSSARAHAGKPVEKWEYGELWHHERRGTTVGPEKEFMSLIEWTSTDGGVRGYGWEEMGGALKVPPLREDELKDEKSDVFEAVQRIRLINHLGQQGWEMIAHIRLENSGSSLWIFKRRIGE